MYDDGRQTLSRRFLRGLFRPFFWHIQRQSKGKNAEKLIDDYRAALDESIEKYGVDARRTNTVRDYLAKHLEGLEKYSDALPLRKVQFEMMRETEGIDSFDALVSGNALAADLIGTGELEEARTLLLSLFDQQSVQGTLGAEQGLYTVRLIDQVNRFWPQQSD